jgi:hypothetical protein
MTCPSVSRMLACISQGLGGRQAGLCSCRKGWLYFWQNTTHTNGGTVYCQAATFRGWHAVPTRQAGEMSWLVRQSWQRGIVYIFTTVHSMPLQPASCMQAWQVGCS